MTETPPLRARWAKIGQQAEVPITGNRAKRVAYGALNIGTGTLLLDPDSLELVAGKDIAGLILVMLVSENKINPISDWELYRTLKLKVARITQSTP